MGVGDDEFKKDTAERRKSSSKKKKSAGGNCCTRLFRKLFQKMYPPKPKVLATSQGVWLRKMAAVSMFFDFCFFVLALLLVGFRPMIVDLLLGFWGYSVYLTLREWSVILYCVFKAIAAGGLMFNSGSESRYAG